MEKIALFPGSFDPFTIGHEEIVLRGLSMFDTIIVAIGKNSTKKTMLSLERRMQLINKVFIDEPRIKVDSYEGLTIHFCKEKGAKFLLRGLRTASDFEYERAIAQMNKNLNHEIESVFLLTAPEHTPICSTIVKDIFNNKGDISEFLPTNITMEDLR